MVAHEQGETALWKLVLIDNDESGEVLNFKWWAATFIGTSFESFWHAHARAPSVLAVAFDWALNWSWRGLGFCVARRLNFVLFVLLSSSHRNFHLRWSRSSNPPSGPGHLEGVSCETQLRFIYHPNPHRLLTLPAGSTLTALVVWCEKSGLTPIKQQSCPTDSSTHFLLVDLCAEKHGRKEIITDLLLFFFNLQLLLLLLTWTDRDFVFAGEHFFRPCTCPPNTEKAVATVALHF